MRATQIIIDNHPQIKRATELTAEFVGTPYIFSEDERIVEGLREFVENVPIRFDSKPSKIVCEGMGNYSQIRVENALRTGMSFSETFFDEEMYGGLLIFDSDRFEVIEEMNFEQLEYITRYGGTIRVDTNSTYWDSFGS